MRAFVLVMGDVSRRIEFTTKRFSKEQPRAAISQPPVKLSRQLRPRGPAPCNPSSKEIERATRSYPWKLIKAEVFMSMPAKFRDK